MQPNQPNQHKQQHKPNAMQTKHWLLFTALMMFFTFMFTGAWQKVRLWNYFNQQVSSGEMFVVDGKYYRYCENEQIITYKQK